MTNNAPSYQQYDPPTAITHDQKIAWAMVVELRQVNAMLEVLTQKIDGLSKQAPSRPALPKKSGANKSKGGKKNGPTMQDR